MSSYSLGKVPEIHVGDLTALKTYATEHVVIIADPVVVSTGYDQKLKTALAGFQVHVHTVPMGEPTVEAVNAAADFARDYPNPLIVAVGGGSALDTAKQVAAVIQSSEGIEHYLLCANPFKGRAKLVAVPTTSGTGSEVTRTCIVSSEGRKMWTWGDELLPDAVILDPEVTVSKPAHITGSTGLDALVHALEACTGQRNNSIANASALHAIALVLQHLPEAVRNSSNLTARQGMQEAALLAGIAIDNCGTGIAHNIGHALGTVYHVPHGVAVTVALHAALAWNVQHAAQNYAEVAKVWGVAVEQLPEAFNILLTACNFQAALQKVSGVNLETEDIVAAMKLPENMPMLNNNAHIPNPEDMVWLAQQTIHSWNTLHG